MIRHRPILAALAVAALGALSACAAIEAASQDPAQALAATPTEQWSTRTKVTGQPDEIRLAVHAGGLSGAQSRALEDLVVRWLIEDAREIVVSAPLEGPQVATARRMAIIARERLIAYGAPAERVRIVGYDAAAADGPVVAIPSDPPLRIGFVRYHVQTPTCGLAWENLTATRENAPMSNFGCAVTANIAAQVANPQDLERPRDSTPVDAGRRDVVIGKYRRGEVTSSARDEQAVGTVSRTIP
ncbi:MAG: pilus (Caulobacter type) biosis lipoprotein CpaD [Caulobacter sp.]|nr:pilus (Caulobacter type) biosis lipoprotein CpaD [Caulobacter sp.]